MSAGKKSSGDEALPEFTSFYLQQATQEFAEDLDKARTADDFKGDALPMLIKALQQGTALFAPADQRRIVKAAEQPSPDDDDAEMPDAASSSSSSDAGTRRSGGSSNDDDDDDDKK